MEILSKNKKEKKVHIYTDIILLILLTVTYFQYKYREFFRATFWPFYTWQRWAMSNRTANEKCRFLVGRVLPVYRQLTTFRAWKKWTYGIYK